MVVTLGGGTSELQAVSNAMVRLHKEQFGRGPTNARSYFAGPDALLCVLQDVLLPAERKLVELGNADHVRASRVAFQAADRKSTRLNSSHANISYAVFCLKKKKKNNTQIIAPKNTQKQ